MISAEHCRGKTDVTARFLTHVQNDLERFMSNLSERAYFAGWMEGTEERLWAFMSDEKDDGAWGVTTLTKEDRLELRRLSEIAQGWICWVGTAGTLCGVMFVPLEQWRRDFEAKRLRSGSSPS
jgi:hypothetical protein